MDSFFKSEGFDTIGFEESVWKRVDGGKYAEDIYVSAHVDDCLIMKERLPNTLDGEVTKYLFSVEQVCTISGIGTFTSC
jgi:hypothetical protein